MNKQDLIHIGFLLLAFVGELFMIFCLAVLYNYEPRDEDTNE